MGMLENVKKREKEIIGSKLNNVIISTIIWSIIIITRVTRGERSLLFSWGAPSREHLVEESHFRLVTASGVQQWNQTHKKKRKSKEKKTKKQAHSTKTKNAFAHLPERSVLDSKHETGPFCSLSFHLSPFWKVTRLEEEQPRSCGCSSPRSREDALRLVLFNIFHCLFVFIALQS